MSSKYANLPDIDTAPDLYQTDSRPPTPARDDVELADDEEGGQGKKEEQSSSKYIQSDNISRQAAAERFGKATQVNAIGADFSGSLAVRNTRRSRPTLQHPPVHGFDTDTYASGSDGPSAATAETPIARLRRLKIETQQLEQDMAGQNREGSEAQNAATDADTLQLLTQLRTVRSELARLESSSSSSSPAEIRSWEGEARNLLSELGKGGSSHHDTAAAVAPVGRPEQNVSGKPLAGLEERITELEDMVGVRGAMVDVSDSAPLPRPLISSLGKLEHQLTLLTQPRNLDAVSRRAKVLVAELESLRSARAAVASAPPTAAPSGVTSGDTKAASADPDGRPSLLSDPTTVAQLSSLFALQPRLEALLPLTPSLLARLRSLASLHASASNFSASLSSLSEAQADGTRRVGEVEGVLSEVRQSFEGNVRTMKGNLDSVEARIEALMKRMSALEGEKTTS